MNRPKLFIEITFHINDLTKTKIRSNVKLEEIDMLLGEFLRTQMGGGKDNSEPNNIEVYEIRLTLDLSGDVWGYKHNCGNLGLRDGIIMQVRQQINNRGIDILVDGVLIDQNEPHEP